MKRVKKIIFIILSILLGLILIFNAYNFISIKVLHKDLASINGYAMLEVVSGSMEPTIYKGDIVIINTKEKNYKENDIITFQGSEGEFITHRILKIDGDFLITKGDNNNSEDNPIKSSAIVGKYITKIKGAGTILSSFKNPFTLVMIFVIGLLACFLLSTDSDGKPILDSEELEFQEFLKSKNEDKKDISKKVENKDTKEIKSKKSSTTKKETSTPKTTKNSKRASSSKKVEAKAPVKIATKKVENKTSATKKTTPKKEVAKKPTIKTSTTKKKVEANTTKKATTKKATGTTKTTKKKNTTQK